MDEFLEGFPFGVWGFVLFCGIAIGAIVQRIVIGEQCSECGRKKAMVKTGNTRPPPGSKSPKWWRLTQEDEKEWKCKFCDYVVWREPPKGGFEGDGGGNGGE